MTAVRAEQRFTKNRRCPICGGADGDPRGQSKRCGGFTSSDGKFAHCAREEHAGSLEVEDGGTYAHRLAGPCKCGSTHSEAERADTWRVVATYDYGDSAGNIVYRVMRSATKQFWQEHPDGRGGWIKGRGGVPCVLYRLPELLAAPKDAIVYIVEGEKDVETLRKHGLVATCNPMGAGKWSFVTDCARDVLAGRHVVVIPDADAPGRAHAADVRQRLTGIVASVRVCELPNKDASDWFAAGHTADELAEIVAAGLDEELQVERDQPPKWPIESASPDWSAEPLPPREHLLIDMRTGRGAMDKIGVWLFAGPGGAGKSYATIGLGLANASGGRWFRTFNTAAAGRTLIVAAEDTTEDIRRRVHAIARAENIPAVALERFHVLPIHDRVTSLVAKVGDAYAPSDDTKSLCDELAGREPYDLVVVDPYGRVAGVSVDADNAAAAATISALAMISSAARGLVLGVTHTSLRARIAAQNGAAEGATGIRGATGQSDFARGVIRLEKDKDAIWLSLAKANHVAQWEPIGLRRGDHGELVPLDAVDLATIAAARSSDGKAAKREAAVAERDELDDAAAKRALAENPSATVRDLIAVVRKARSCGTDRAHAAVTRARLGTP